MKNRLFIAVSVVLLVALPEISWSLQNPGVGNPVGSYTMPPSSISSGLVRSPNPVGTSSGLAITGNVRRGKHFRGVISRQSRTNFQAPLGSTYLDSFLRSAASSEDIGNYSRDYRPQPFYSPTGTVTTTMPGRSGIFNSATAKVDSRALGTPSLKTNLKAPSVADLSLQKQRVTLSPQATKTPDYSLRPMRISPGELERLISDGVEAAGRARRLVNEEDLAQMERLRRDLEQLKNRASNLRQSLVVRDDSLRPFDKLRLGKEKKLSLEPQPIKELTEQTSAFETTKPMQQLAPDVHEQLRRQLDDLQKALEQVPYQQQAEETARDEKEKIRKSPSDVTGLKEDYLGKSRELLREQISVPDRVEQLSEQPDMREDVSGSSETNLPVGARHVLREYENFASFLNDKFDQHLSTAGVYLKQGRYYQAVDAYTLASVYKPDDPIAYIGRSHALFAAGEYMSSALFLSRGLKISPELARVKVDFVAILGDEDKLDRRITEAKEWLQRSDAAELEFLLGYVYYQTGELDSAMKAINTAHKKNPNSPAVGAVKKAIDEAH